MKVPSANQSIFVEILVAECKTVLNFMECSLSPLFHVFLVKIILNLSNDKGWDFPSRSLM